MKKLPILLFGIITLFFTLTVIRPLLSQAQGCGGIMGSNVAANWYRENLEYIRNNAGCSGPIPIEVIITPAERDNPSLLLELQNNLIELNFIPTWRPWGNGMPQGSELQAWIDAASVLTIGQFQLFNEPNNCYFGCFSGSTPNPTADAAAALAFLEASQRGEIAIPLALMPLSPRTPDGGNFLSEQTYWTQFNNACGGCVSQFDYIGLNIYPLTTPGADPNINVNNFINDFNAQLNFFASLGVNVSATSFLIVEAGLDPGSYAGNFQQRVADTIAFAQALEQRILSDPSLFINIDQITFFLMDDAGNQYLVFRQCDAAGNCQWVVEGFLIYNPNIPGWIYQLTCNPSNPGDQDSRPVPCDPCNQTDLLTPSCATTFAVNDEVTYLRGDVDFWCPDENPKPWLEREWGGIVTIDPSDTTIPFVGKKGQEDRRKYLADYLEGICPYYTGKPCVDPQYGWEVWAVLTDAGPWQAFSSETIQDDFKKQMVNRAHQSLLGRIQEGAIHDYLVEYNGESAKLSEFSGHYPPEDPIERKKWEKETKWGRLWVAVPMFSREDTPGWINPYLGARPLDRFEILNPEAQIEKVPHVARLYEVSQALQQLLLPRRSSGGETQAKTKSFLASAKEKVLGQQVLPAQTGEPSFSAYGYCNRLDGNYTVYLTVGFSLPPDHHCRDINVEIKSPIYWQHTCNNERVCSNLVVNPFTVSGQPGGGINVSYAVKAHGVTGPGGSPWIPNVELNGSFAVQFTEDGCIVAGGPIPEPPSCGLRAPIPVAGCEMPAITDPNPNDDLCCSPINIALSATDQFENVHYIPCGVEVECWVDIYGNLVCRDECERQRTHAVNRKIGISLLHPYLNEIWDYTTDVFDGFFNIFRPETVPEFEDLAAASSIFYSYDSDGVSPPGGDFYFPYLGGIQKAKEWVITALNPKGGARPPGPAAPTTPTTLDYTIDFRNPGITISDENKNEVITMVKFYWPGTKIETHWDYVYDQAVAHGWNPAFVIALWIEESGASGIDAYDLGCLGAPRNNLSAQLDCLFSRPYANESFEEFMCMYSEGAHAPCTFAINPNFPGNLKKWYDRLTQ